jgi:hypothetical protein
MLLNLQDLEILSSAVLWKYTSSLSSISSFFAPSLVSLCLHRSASDGLGLRITTSCISHIYMCHIRRSDRSCGPIDLDPQRLIKRHWASALDIGILSYGSVVEGTGVTR